jgi:predicted nucleic acid-binding protein
MVLVDTSVWIRFLSNQSPFAAGLDRLLSRGEVWGHEFIYGELLIGDRGGRRELLADYGLMHQAPLAPHRDVVEFVRERRLHGRGIGWIDTHLLASTLLGGLALWTADPRLAAVARELDVVYEA